MAAMPMSLADFVGVQRSTARAYGRADKRAFLSAGESADAGTRSSRSRYRQFVAMLLPEGTAMTTMPTHRLRGRYRCRRKSQY